MADITLSYKGSTIATMSASGSKTIQTKEKYCEDDISLAYIKDESNYNILKGSAQPTAGIGQDGDVYLQFATLDGEIENTYVKVNGAWQALVGSDVDNVSNSGMYTGVEEPPPASMGLDGDYYYQRNNWLPSIKSVNMSQVNGSSSIAYGNEFTVTEQVTVTRLFAMTTENRTGKLQLGTTSEILAETESVTFPANEWVEVALVSPIQLAPGTRYVVKASIDSAYNTGKVGWVTNVSSMSFDSKFSYVQARYGASWPGTSESSNGVLVGISYLESDGLYRIRKQFYKSSGSWSEI